MAWKERRKKYEMDDRCLHTEKKTRESCRGKEKKNRRGRGEGPYIDGCRQQLRKAAIGEGSMLIDEMGRARHPNWFICSYYLYTTYVPCPVPVPVPYINQPFQLHPAGRTLNSLVWNPSIFGMRFDEMG